MGDQQPYYTIRTRRPVDVNSVSSADSTVRGPHNGRSDVGVGKTAGSQSAQYGSSSGDNGPRPATHDISRVNYHVKHIKNFAERLEDSAKRAFPNTGRNSARYKKVQALLLHWTSDDLFVLPELEDLEKTLREDYAFETDTFSIPSDNSHLELMMRIAMLIKDHEDPETLFVIYYGGHARIDESRQSTWCATRHPESPWLQWSAIQTLLERSASDVLILLDCCAGAASATFPNGSSITETISASSWDAIAPDPGRYSFTNALIEVLGEWRTRTFSAAMLHAEVLARLKHPRPITINGKHFEARSTPVHFMMTSNHKAPSIEMCRVVPVEQRPPSPPSPPFEMAPEMPGARGPAGFVEDGGASSADADADASTVQPVAPPTEDVPHVMISLALEDDQRLDLKAWETWLGNFPALAKYVKVQGVFKSHSTLLLLSMPVMIWDLLPEDHAASFVAFIRSNNLMLEKPEPEPEAISEPVRTPVPPVREPDMTEHAFSDRASFFSDTTYTPSQSPSVLTEALRGFQGRQVPVERDWLASRPNQAMYASSQPTSPRPMASPSSSPVSVFSRPLRSANSSTSLVTLQRQTSSSRENIQRMPLPNQHQSSRRTVFAGGRVPEPPKFAAHVEVRLDAYYDTEAEPNDAQINFVASNLGIEPYHVQTWFYHRRQRDLVAQRLNSLKIGDSTPEQTSSARMILPSHLNGLLEIFAPGQVLLIDVRTLTDFSRSHILGAVNLRVPARFAQQADFSMLERSITDDQSRRTLSGWRSTKAMVFYDRKVDVPLECPVAEALFYKFRNWGWDGHCFILKGHYREFSSTYDKYIVGNNMTDAAKEYLDSLRQRPKPDVRASEKRYETWLSQVETGDRVNSSSLSPVDRQERSKVVADQQQNLEEEFQRRAPDLATKAAELSEQLPPPAWDESTNPSAWPSPAGPRGKERDNFDRKAPFVEYLDRGLTKIRDQAQAQPSSDAKSGSPAYQLPPAFAEGYSKLGHEGAYLDSPEGGARPPSDGFVEINKGEEQDDPAFLKAGMRATAEGGSGEELPRRGRGGFLNKVLRR